MRVSRLFPRTLHQAPSEAVEPSHQLLLRAGYVRALGAGVFGLLPLGRRVCQRVQDLLGEVLTRLGGQEIALPPLPPADSWEEAGLRRRGRSIGLSLRDRLDRPFLWPHTLDPLITALVRHDLRSHRLLPLLVYQFRPRFWDGGPVGSSPLSAQLSSILEAFSLQTEPASLATSVGELRELVVEVLQRVGLSAVAAETVVGPEDFPGHAFVDPDVPGSQSFVRCPGCGYAADVQVARRGKQAPSPEEPLPLEEVLTPNCHTIAALAEFLGVPERRTAKAVFLVSEDRFFFVIVRGDMDVNEDKLARLVGARELRPALEYEIGALGASPGYASPMGISRQAPDAGIRQVLIVVDDLIPHCPNLVAGANKEETHLRNVNFGRDYAADLLSDLVLVRDGDPCPHCDTPLELFQSTVLGRIWAPGPHYSDALGAAFHDAEGERHIPLLVSAEMEVDRLMAAVVERHHDENGIRWPAALTPYAVYLLPLGNAPEVLEAAARLYQNLVSAGISVLFDDRDERAGVKFTDADLLGMPLRVAVSRRTLEQESAEVKRRDQPREAAEVIPLGEVVDWARRTLVELAGQ